MALYDGASGPHQVDWYWQARSAAAIPEQTKVLFDRVGLPHLQSPPQLGYQPVPEQDPLEALSNTVCFFWVMLLISAKYVARSAARGTTSLGLVPFGPLAEVRSFVGKPPEPAPASTDEPVSTADAVALLRRLAEEMERLMPKVFGVRRWGAGTIDLAYVACGRYDAYWEQSVAPWDIAAGVVLVEEAGGVACDTMGRPLDLMGGTMLGCTPQIKDDLLRELSPIDG